MTSLKILIIDDDPTLLSALESILRDEGHAPIVASSGQSGIDIFKSSLTSGRQFDVVITDLAMPYVDGSLVVAAIKAVAPATPIILLTGWEGDAEREAAAAREVNLVLGKPIYISKLREALTRVTS